VASADYASFVITKNRDVCFTGSLVERLSVYSGNCSNKGSIEVASKSGLQFLKDPCFTPPFPFCVCFSDSAITLGYFSSIGQLFKGLGQHLGNFSMSYFK